MAESQDMDRNEKDTATGGGCDSIKKAKRDDVTRRLFALKRRVQTILEEIDELNKKYHESAD